MNFPFCTEDEHFSVIEKFFTEKGPVLHQFESYEHMVHHTIQKIFDECTSISIETKNTAYKATFGQVYFEKASITDENRVLRYITPNEARLRDLTYDSPVFVDIKEEFWEKGEKVNQLNHPKVFMLRMPTMVRSSRCNLYGLSMKECMEQGECENDPGGYFIVNGKERALICQERLNYNQVYLFESNSDKYPHIAEIRSMSEETCHSVLLKAIIDKDFRNCCFSLPYMSKEVLAGTVFKALGFTNEQIYELINPYSKEEVKLTERLIRESMIYNTKEKAIKYISKSSIQKVEDSEERRIHYTIQVIENELFPHMGISTNLEKGILLGTMINKLFRVCLGKRTNEDRDNVSIKRIEGPGVLLSDLFRMCLKRYCDNLKKYLEKRQDIITAISRTNSITTAIKSPMCFVKGTLVSLSNGTSLPIESLQDIGNNVLGWNKDTGLLKPSIQTHFFNQGKRETIILTFEDGRTIQCTPDHKLLNEKSTWIEACSIPNGSQVFCHDKELYLKLIKLVDIRPGNTQTVYDITVEDTHSFLANGIVSSNCTGNWTAQKNTYVRTGVSQIMSRLTYPATISHLRRIVIPIGKEGKNVKIRQVHPTQCFFVDIIESPEGKGIGIIKNFSLLAKLSVGCNSILVRKLVEECDHFQSTQTYFEIKDPIMIYLNGTLIGITDHPDEYYQQLKNLKFVQNVLSDQVSFTMDKDEHEIRIFSDHGRFMRPLLTIENNELLLTKKDLVKSWCQMLEDDIIRYVDSNEVENSLIAMFPSNILEYSNQTYHYCELHPSTMLGACSAVIPYGEHNQNPRLVYEASMLKQALGVYSLAYKNRFDTISHVMQYPQKPLVETKYNKMLHYDEMLTGFNPIVAVACYTGFNQEDSLVLNKSSVDRGMFVTTAYRTLVYEEKKKTNCSFEKIEIPPLKSQNKTMNYSKLGPDGIVMKGLPVYKGDIIVGKTLTKVQKEDKEEKMDCSLSISSGEEGIVDEIWTDMNEEGYFMVKIKIRQLRIPEVGDKLACFTDKTSVLTDKGWKSIKDVSKEDKVATLQHGEIVYDFPLETFEYDYEGKMYHLVSKQLDMTVTPNHKLYVKRRNKKEYELIKAEDVFGKRVSHQKNGEWKKEDQQYLEIENFGKVNVKAWCYFLGILYAERSGTCTYKSVNSGIIISVNKKCVDKLQDFLTYLDIPFKYNKNEKKINIYNQSLFHHFREFNVGTVNKKLPDYVWNFSKEESRCLLEDLLLGDGSKCQNSITYWTSSFKLAEDVQKLALHCGYSSNMILPEGRKAGSINIMKDGRAIQSTADNYRVAIITTKNNPTVNHGHIQIEEWIDYKGKVYCIEVPEHVIYVKQNGKPYWSGNSRSSQKGVCGLLLEQENMPFTSQGITPDLIMNPHCFTKETLVTLCNGLSKRISDMSVSGGEDVWCHDKKSGITMSKNLSMGCGGVKPIVKLTFEDGRTIRCTHGHQFYTSDGKWIEAQNIELGKDKIQMSLEGVFDEIGEDENVDWLFFNDREKTLAFARILGYTLADGCICKSNGSFSCPISFGHDIDAELCKKDILLLTGKSPKIQTNNSSIGAGNVYIVNLPCELVKLIVNLDGITIGRRTQQETTWPSFLFTSPKSVIREFLAGLFGGDGHAPYLRGEHVQEIRFSQTTTRKYEDHFTQKMQSLCDLLNLFHVDACIERKRYYHKSTQKECSLEDIKEDEDYMTTIYIIIKDSLAFTQNIGMRYCIEKMSRLSLYKSYKLLQKCVKKQSEDIFALVDFYNKKGNTLQKSLCLAREEYFKTNICLNEYYTFGINGKTQLGNRRKENRSSDVLHLNYKYFPTFKKYIENLGCLHWYSNKEYAIDREASVLPTFNMKVVGRVDDGEEPIYCFNVKDFNNFIAEGTVVSNSIPSRMTLSQLIECLYSKVGSLDGTFGDSTAFTEQSINPVEDIAKKLKSYGFQRYGNERMYNGFTGEMIDSDIFIGPTYYQRLKHLVADKIHCLTPDHDVLTISGWKKILDVTLKDKVATLNQKES